MPIGTFIRLYGQDTLNELGSLDVQVAAGTVPAPVNTAVTTLAAATFDGVNGTPKPSEMHYVGFEYIISSVPERFALDPVAGAGDVRSKWDFSASPVGAPPIRFHLPGRMTGPGSEELYDAVNTVLWNRAGAGGAIWTAFIDALAVAALSAPADKTGAFAPIVGAIANSRSRVKPRVRASR